MPPHPAKPLREGRKFSEGFLKKAENRFHAGFKRAAEPTSVVRREHDETLTTRASARMMRVALFQRCPHLRQETTIAIRFHDAHHNTST